MDGNELELDTNALESYIQTSTQQAPAPQPIETGDISEVVSI